MIKMKKSERWNYIPFGMYTGYQNMAIDEYILEQVAQGRMKNTIRFYRWSPTTASIGLHQSLSAEINLENARKKGVDIVRRISGGGAVLHEKNGEITYAVICKIKDLPKINELKLKKKIKRIYDPSISSKYQIILESLAVGLEKLGIPVDSGKIHCPALLTQGKKLSGNAQTIKKNVLLQHGTILLNVKPEFMYSILRAPPNKTYTKMVASVRAKVVGIKNLAGFNSKLSYIDIIKSLKEGFKEIMEIDFEDYILNQQDWNNIFELERGKYRKNEWLNKYE